MIPAADIETSATRHKSVQSTDAGRSERFNVIHGHSIASIVIEGSSCSLPRIQGRYHGETGSSASCVLSWTLCRNSGTASPDGMCKARAVAGSVCGE